ncbi:Diphthamide biosynthesis protein 2 [Vanrija albida]|uniref:2-(3-amino-3-carboxypropyl)histidine synthase subunit 2 n=1 Tax=Vanrija albida TaxID=181172 RepID=A0ABR3Q2A0_9TREE
MASADAFYTSAAVALEETVGDGAAAGPSSMGDAAAALSLDDAFDIPNTARLILEGGYKTIGLQFPDELLPSSVAVYRALQRLVGASGAQTYVLADSTHGACCPDVLSCLHLPADFLVHYGHACLTPTDALPVHYVFPRRSLDVAAAVEALRDVSKDEVAEKRGIVVVWDVAYDWHAEDIVREFQAAVDVPISFATIRRPSTLPKTEGVDTADAKGKAPALRSIQPPAGVEMADSVIWYIGEEGRSLLNLQMTHATNQLFAYAPDTGAFSVHPRSSRLLQKRLFALHSAMAADVFGLVVGNIGLASSKPLVEELRQALKLAQKKSYTLSVGRLNPAKLANFAEIECFVLIGCAEGGVVDSKDYLRPMITPYELTLALKGSEHIWDPSKWTLDLDAVLGAAKEESERLKDQGDESEEELEFSLVTGRYRTRRKFGKEDSQPLLVEGTKELTLRNQDASLAKLESAGSMFLQSRTFQGLEARYGQDEPALLEQGRSGIARGYTQEK